MWEKSLSKTLIGGRKNSISVTRRLWNSICQHLLSLKEVISSRTRKKAESVYWIHF